MTARAEERAISAEIALLTKKSRWKYLLGGLSDDMNNGKVENLIDATTPLVATC